MQRRDATRTRAVCSRRWQQQAIFRAYVVLGLRVLGFRGEGFRAYKLSYKLYTVQVNRRFDLLY